MVSSGGNTGLRSRKIENDRLLPVYRYSDLQPDLLNSQLIQRAAPQVATGVEKEEEEEKHLQAALVSGSANLNEGGVFIPTPDASAVFKDYDKYYSRSFIEPRNLTRFTGRLEDATGCPYSIDNDGSEFVKKHHEKWNKSLEDAKNITEFAIYSLESFANLANDPKIIPTLQEAQKGLRLNFSETFDMYANELPDIFEYWKSRRFASGESIRIIPMLRISTDKSSSESTDPFVCFRKREVRTYKKTQRSNVMSREYLSNIETLINTSKALFDMFMQRALFRKTLLQIECQILERILLLKKYQPIVKPPAHDLAAIYANMLDRNLHTPDINSHDNAISALKPPPEYPPAAGSYLDDLPAKKKKPRSALYWRQSPSTLLFNNVLNSNMLGNASATNLFVRRRLGRGGRILLDRRISFRNESKPSLSSSISGRANDNPFTYPFGPPDDDFRPYRVLHTSDTSRLIAHRVFSLLSGENELRNLSTANKKEPQNHQVDKQESQFQNDRPVS